jgi:polysaccharide biosynthesis protein PelD
MTAGDDTHSLEPASAAEPKRIAGLRRVAVLETVGFLAAVLALDALLFGGNRYWGVEPHPFWIVVVLMAAQYGTPEGLLAAVLSSIALLAGNLPEQPIDADFHAFLYDVLKHPLLWCVTAVTLGELRRRHIAERDTLKSGFADASGRLARMEEGYARVSRIKENLERRVAGQLRTFLTTYETAKLIERSDPGEVLLAIVDVIRSIIGPRKFSLFLLNNNVLEAAIQDGWEAGDRFARVFQRSSPLFREVVEQGRILCITNEADEPALGGEGVLACPLIHADTDAVIGMLKIERIEILDLNVSTIENLRALSRWIGTAYAKAMDIAAQGEESAYVSGRDVMPARLLPPQQYFVISLGRRVGFDVTAIRLRADGASIPAGRHAEITVAVGEAVRLALGATSLPFDEGGDGSRFTVLAPGLSAKNAPGAAERLSNALATQLRSRVVDVHFTHEVQLLYQQERDSRERH